MAIEIRVIGETTEEVAKDVRELSARFGLKIEGLSIQYAAGEPVIGTSTGEMAGAGEKEPAKRGRKRRDPAEVAGALTGAGAGTDAAGEPEAAGGDPFGDDNGGDDPFAPAGNEKSVGEALTKEQLEAVKKEVMARLQKVYTQKGGSDTVNALMSKHCPSEKKIVNFPLEVFPAMMEDLHTLGV